ncbi:MAG: glycosyltransferase family 2 protein, partial [Elusimicrobia bacterium]|nr:glycosyltransferase family 2 protein [Elusimicrobiota bacterium]
VDDGSRDGSARAARAVAGVRLISHRDNRGYGAALKTGFSVARGEWVAFLDGDGTCDPACLEALFERAWAADLDVVIGGRLHSESRMPLVRGAGNRFFRALASLCGAQGVGDVASGIRVVRRSAYERMAPLPDGMDFTPAMSARALLDPDLRLGELPVPYGDRAGSSKLAPLADGLRFMRVIVEAGLLYRPRLLFGWAAAGLLALSAALFALRLGGPSSPLADLFAGTGAARWMYFRFILIAACAASAAFLAALGLVAQALVDVVHRAGRAGGPGPAARLARSLPVLGALLFGAGVLVNLPPLASYARTGHIPDDYWALPLAGGVLSVTGLELWGFWVAARIAELLWQRRPRPAAAQGRIAA